MEGEEYLDENSILRPVSLYARLKVKFEKYIMQHDDSHNAFVTSLRFATAFGLSPRMRFDLTVNEFVRELTLGNELLVYGENFWRPYCHTKDISKACELMIEAGYNKVHKQVFGVGNTAENYTKKMIVDEIEQVIPNINIKYVKKVEDPRDYKVNFSKIKKLGFINDYNLIDGIKEIHEALLAGVFEDAYSDLYKNS